MFKSCEIEVPSWTTLKLATNEDNLEAAYDASIMILHNNIDMLITSVITQAPVHLKDPPTVDFLVGILKAGEDFDTKNSNPNIPSSEDSINKIVTFPWAAHHRKIPTVRTVLASSTLVSDNSALLHKRYLQSLTHIPHPLVKYITKQKVFDSMNAKLNQLIAQTIMLNLAAGPVQNNNKCSAKSLFLPFVSSRLPSYINVASHTGPSTEPHPQKATG